jgi:hypothetical protein
MVYPHLQTSAIRYLGVHFDMSIRDEATSIQPSLQVEHASESGEKLLSAREAALMLGANPRTAQIRAWIITER